MNGPVQCDGIGWFDENFIHSRFQCGNPCARLSVRGECHYSLVGDASGFAHCANHFGGFETIHYGHLQIHQDGVVVCF